MTVNDHLLTPNPSGCRVCHALRKLPPAGADLLRAALADTDVRHVDIHQWLNDNGYPIAAASSVAAHRASHK